MHLFYGTSFNLEKSKRNGYTRKTSQEGFDTQTQNATQKVYTITVCFMPESEILVNANN